MQAPWRPSNLHNHATSCPSPPPTTRTAPTHRMRITAIPSKGLYCNPHLASRRELLLVARRPKRSKFSNGVSWGGLLDEGRMMVGVCCHSSSGEVGYMEKVQGDGYLVRESGWGVRRMVEEELEMKSVAYVQAEAFHVPVALFDGLFFQFFQAEVLSALIYRLRNSPPDRYTCLVAEPVDASNLMLTLPPGLVGVVDLTVQRDGDVLRYLDAKEEYLYVSGIAVLKDYRRMKVGSSLLKACEAMSKIWGFRYLVLRAYEDDLAALQLYTKQGYRVVSRDPKWMTTWIGRRRRVLMIKST